MARTFVKPGSNLITRQLSAPEEPRSVPATMIFPLRSTATPLASSSPFPGPFHDVLARSTDKAASYLRMTQFMPFDGVVSLPTTITLPEASTASP